MNFSYGMVFPVLVCCMVGVLTYLNTLQCGIVYDDEPAIKKNQDLLPQTPWVNILTHDFWGAEITSASSHKSYRPLCVATFRLNYLLHGLEPMGYHLVNVVLHGVVCLLYAIMCALVSRSVWQSLVAGLLFAVHPIHTEAVAGLVGRTELLSAIFFIMAFLAYRKSIAASSWWLILSMFFTLCSALSKEQGITVVAISVTYEFFIVHKMTLGSCVQLLSNVVSKKRKLSPLFPPWFPGFLKRAFSLAVFVAVFLSLRVYLMEQGPNIFTVHVNPPLFMDTPYRQLNWLYLVVVNVWQLLNPSFLCPDWRFDTIPLITSTMDPRNLLTILTLTTLATLGLHCLHYGSSSAKMVLFSLSLLVFPFLPASNLFFPVGFVVAERVLYLPSMGCCLLVSHGIITLLRVAKRSSLRGCIVLLFLVLVTLFGARSYLRNEDWVSNLTLYSSGVRCNSHNGVMLTNLGIEHGRLKNFTFAKTLYRRSIEVAPEHSRGYSNLGGLMEALKKYDEAEEALRKAVIVGEKDSTATKVFETYIFLINSVILRKGVEPARYHDALELWDQAIASYPKYAVPYGWKGTVLYLMGRVEEAIPLLEVAVQSHVHEAGVYYYLGLCYQAGRGSEGKGKELFRKTLQLDPGHSGAKEQLLKEVANLSLAA